LHGIIDTRTGQSVSAGATPEEAMRLYKREERENQLKDALKYEGEHLKHCVGGYCPDVSSGETRIFSLRDAEGKPHATIEVKKKSVELTNEEMNEIFDAAKRETNALYPSVEDANKWSAKFHHRSEELRNELIAEKAKDTPEYIKQIKGESNAAPKKELQPFVQDFVKSGDWYDVRDIKNAGMVKIDKSMQEDLRHVGMENVPSYIPESDYDDLLIWSLGAGQRPKGYAQGGTVRMAEGDVVNLDDIINQALARATTRMNHA
jgi:hypothetical protein